jgi:hypothetical protein
MTLEEIEDEWREDSRIDTSDLTRTLTRIPELHSKYYKVYVRSRMILNKTKAAYKRLKLEKYEFYTNPTEEGFDRGWELPAQGKILKNEVQSYLEGDNDLIEIELKIGMHEEKVSFLKSILDSIHGKNWIINNIIKDRAFMHGE